MQFLTASLVIVDGLSATIASDAIYSNSDQDTVRGEAANGLWPFYLASSDVASNEVTFGEASGMKIETTTQPGHPIVLGANVLGVARFLGHGGR